MLSAFRKARDRSVVLLAVFLLSASIAGAYKPRPWTLRSREDYPAKLASEGLTIAAEPLFLDSLAGQVFDKSDMVTRGIMPLGVVIFNDNNFAIRLDCSTIEVISGEEHIHSVPPIEAVHQLFKGGTNILAPSRIPRQSINQDALADFEAKSLERTRIGAHERAGGFLYLRIPLKDVRSYLSGARLYIPDVYREDNGSRLIFFEIELKPALGAVPAK